MSEDFLSRWSRRKQAAAHAADPAKSPPDRENSAAQEHAAEPDATESLDTSSFDKPGPAQNAPDPGAPTFDPASLPPIESITAETDIRAFFAAGVPAELTRAALRRVWTSDPKIRDFVGLADYAWDFNTPGSMAGFGPLEGADVLRAQVARWVGPGAAEDGAAATSDRGLGAKRGAPVSDASLHNHPGQPTPIMTEDEPPQTTDQSQNRDEPRRPDDEHVTTPHQDKPEDVQTIARRKHGRALPRS